MIVFDGIFNPAKIQDFKTRYIFQTNKEKDRGLKNFKNLRSLSLGFIPEKKKVLR